MRTRSNVSCSCKDYKAGDLRNTAILMAPKYEDDGCGGDQGFFVQKGKMLCKVVNKSGSRSFFRQADEQMRTVVFIARFRNDIQPEDEIVFKGWRHTITSSINVEEKNIWMVIDTIRGERPIDQVDIANELLIYDSNGNVELTPEGEAVSHPFNNPVKDDSEQNETMPDGGTVFTLDKSTVGI